MQRLFASLCIFIGFTAPILAADIQIPPGEAKQESADKRWEAVIATDLRYFSYRSTFGYPPLNAAAAANSRVRGKAWQLYAPLGLQVVGLPSDDAKVEFLIRGGYVSSKQSTPFFEGSYSGLTDTIVSGTITYLPIAGIQPFVSLNLNVPTGETVLSGNSARARLDPDFVDIPTFGEGWNIGPTLGANIPITEDILFSASIGYTNRGSYSYESPTQLGVNPSTNVAPLTSDFDPGDNVTLSSSLTYRAGSLSGQLTSSYSFETTMRTDGLPSLQVGDRFLLSGTLGYEWTEAWSTTVSAAWSHTQANKVVGPQFGQPLPTLLREAFNSNSNAYRVGFDATYRATPALSFGPTLSILYRDENAYLPYTGQFVPAKTRWSAGGSLNYTINDSLSVGARIEHIWAQQRARPEPDLELDPTAAAGIGLPRQSAQGWSISTSLLGRF
ncbi:hypothetical protein ACETIH_28525 [Microvirga arabica]|uniref:Uncharacterized protein n=1 Tax=Microvirga arabica TaxID=1128671 RepID=A0ABV6YH28_9HYPH